MNVHRALLGVFDGEPYLGSLDFLHGQARLAAWPSSTQQVESEQGIGEPPPPMDLVIMNPPFTRDSLRHDQFSRADEQAIKRREKEIMEGQPYREAARLSGSANAFMDLRTRPCEKMAAHWRLCCQRSLQIPLRPRLASTLPDDSTSTPS